MIEWSVFDLQQQPGDIIEGEPTKGLLDQENGAAQDKVVKISNGDDSHFFGYQWAIFFILLDFLSTVSPINI